MSQVRSAGAGPAIEFVGVNKSFGRVHVVRDVELAIREGEFFSLLGPSGCGKTTSLRMIAGFEEPDSGRVLLRGTDVTHQQPNKRNVNMVFQNYELFPHMTVFDNVAYGLKLKRVPRAEIRRRVTEMMGVVRIIGLEDRGARQLSGGQQQRVALARALVNQPAALLLDEPLSALDVKLRRQMQFELKAIQHQLGTTFVYVTHDQEEALLMSDRIAIMNEGRILQVASPREIYDRPADAFVADFVGSLNVLVVTIVKVDGPLALGRPAEGEVVVVELPDGQVGGQVRVAIRPERIRLQGIEDPVGPNVTRLRGSIRGVDYAGATTQYRVATKSVGDLVVHRANDAPRPEIGIGEAVAVTWPADAGFVLPGGS